MCTARSCALAQFLVVKRCWCLLLGRLRSLEAVPVYAQLPYFGFECLSGNAQLNGSAGWTPNHAFGFPESGFEDLSFVLDEVSNQRNARRGGLGSQTSKPRF